MKERTKLGLGVLEAALLLGVLGDALLRATPWGLNVLLWVLALVLAFMALVRRKGVPLWSGEGGWLLPSALFFAAAFAWRDSLTLKFLDVLAILMLVSLASRAARGAAVRLAGATQYAFSLCVSGFNAAFGVFPLIFSDIVWKEIPQNGWKTHAWAAARGLFIAAPLLALFGALFMAADAVFDGIVRSTFNIDFDVLTTHIALACFFAWASGGFLRGTVLATKKSPTATVKTLATTLGLSGESRSVVVPSVTAPEPEATDAKAMRSETSGAHESNAKTGAEGESDARRRESTGGAKQTESSGEAKTAGASPALKMASKLRRPSLGIVEISTALGLVNLLFFCFVAVQVRYFFGGAEWVAASAGTTYAEYARRGFFELVWVATLVLPLLMVAHWLLRKENPAHERIFRALAGALVVMLFIIMVSAVKRMRLYQSEYGMTELRLYTTAFMGWLAVVFVWFAATVLRGRRERFACGALVAALCLLGALHLLNPDAFIVRTNAELVRRGRAFDASYAASLSADAVPALVRALPEVSASERRHVAARLVDRWRAPEQLDWRTWNWSRAEAWQAVRENSATLREWARDPDKEREANLSNEALREIEGR